MNTELIQNLFDYLLANPTTTESELLDIAVQSSDHTTETATEWFNAFYTGLYEAMILESSDYECMRSKIITQDNLSVKVIVEVMEKYFISNPLEYETRRRITELTTELEAIEILQIPSGASELLKEVINNANKKQRNIKESIETQLHYLRTLL